MACGTGKTFTSLLIAERLACTSDTPQFTVVFSTYQSIDVVAEAQRLFSTSCNDEAAWVFDLIIADEAHRTTGVTLLGKGDGDFVRVHDNSFIKARHRMYMTATPRIYTDSAKVKATEKDECFVLYG